jgi:hypothetical protein
VFDQAWRLGRRQPSAIGLRVVTPPRVSDARAPPAVVSVAVAPIGLLVQRRRVTRRPRTSTVVALHVTIRTSTNLA